MENVIYIKSSDLNEVSEINFHPEGLYSKYFNSFKIKIRFPKNQMVLQFEDEESFDIFVDKFDVDKTVLRAAIADYDLKTDTCSRHIILDHFRDCIIDKSILMVRFFMTDYEFQRLSKFNIFEIKLFKRHSPFHIGVNKKISYSLPWKVAVFVKEHRGALRSIKVSKDPYFMEAFWLGLKLDKFQDLIYLEFYDEVDFKYFLSRYNPKDCVVRKFGSNLDLMSPSKTEIDNENMIINIYYHDYHKIFEELYDKDDILELDLLGGLG